MLGNSMDCYSADDVYLLLKSSDFVSFDLNHAFDQVVSDLGHNEQIPWALVLRKSFSINPSVEFRCFARERRLIGATQRDMNYYPFLHQARNKFMGCIEAFFEERLRDTFPDDNFVFDVYIPDPYKKVWLIDINPWAPRTDPLLFSWLELLVMELPEASPPQPLRCCLGGETNQAQGVGEGPTEHEHNSSENGSDSVADLFVPELRLLNRDDPEAYGSASPQYSAHKVPKDVVDAAAQGNTKALRELSLEWQAVLENAREGDCKYTSSEDGDG